MPRIHCPEPLSEGALIALPPGAARHVQVLRMQPGETVTLFDGHGGQWQAAITRMGRSEVQVQVQSHEALECEAPRAVWLAPGMPANDRMDWLVEKATELGVAGIAPLVTERSVLRLSGERAERKQAHWQGVAAAACEQCGRNRLPAIDMPQGLGGWLAAIAAMEADMQADMQAASGASHPAGGVAVPRLRRLVLSLEGGARALAQVMAGDAATPVVLLSGPEGGLSAQETAQALAAGFEPVTLGPRVLRAETAPLAALAILTA